MIYDLDIAYYKNDNKLLLVPVLTCHSWYIEVQTLTQKFQRKFLRHGLDESISSTNL